MLECFLELYMSPTKVNLKDAYASVTRVEKYAKALWKAAFT